MLNRRNIGLLTGIGFSILFTWIAVRGTDLASIWAALSRGSLTSAAEFLVLLGVFCVIKAFRWATLLDANSRATTGRLLPTVLIGYLGTAVMPMQLGEVLRAHTAARRVRAPFITILSSLAVERIFDVLGLVSLVSVLILAGSPEGRLLWATGALMALGSLLLLAMLVIAVARPGWVHAAVKLVSGRLSAQIRESLVRHTDNALQGMAVLKKPSKFLSLLAYSVVQWIFMWGCVWASLDAFSLDVPIAGALAVLAAAVIGMMLPSGPGYIGTFQLAFTLTLAPFGVSNADALAASLFYQVMLWIPLSLAGLVCLRRTDLRLRRAIEVDDATGEFKILNLSESEDPGDPPPSPELPPRSSQQPPAS